jgi:hypothetical protein
LNPEDRSKQELNPGPQRRQIQTGIEHRYLRGDGSKQELNTGPQRRQIQTGIEHRTSEETDQNRN